MELLKLISLLDLFHLAQQILNEAVVGAKLYSRVSATENNKHFLLIFFIKGINIFHVEI